MRGQARLFDVDNRLKRLTDLDDQLEAFRPPVNFELLRPELNAALDYSDGAQGGPLPFDPVLMTSAPSFSSMTGSRSCAFLGWGVRTVFRTPARSGCYGRNSPQPGR